MFVPVTLLFVHKVYIGEPWGLLLPMAVGSLGKGCGIRGFNEQGMDQARCLALGGPFLASYLGLGLGC
jgi:hypothetical protein